MFIHTLNSVDVSDCLVNIVSGKVAPLIVNVGSAIELGRSEMAEFEWEWLLGFNSIICKVVQLFTLTTFIHRKVQNNLFRSYFQSNRRPTFKFKKCWYERRFVAGTGSCTSIHVCWIRRHANMYKTRMKAQLHVQTSSQFVIERHNLCWIVDGSAVLYIINWSPNETLLVFVNYVKGYIHRKLSRGDVYLVLYKLREYGTKNIKMAGRSRDCCWVYESNNTSISTNVVFMVQQNQETTHKYHKWRNLTEQMFLTKPSSWSP